MAGEDQQLQVDYKSQFPTATRIENGIAFDASGKQLGPVKGMEADQNQNAGWNEVKTQAAPADSEWKEVTTSQTAVPASTDLGGWRETPGPAQQPQAESQVGEKIYEAVAPALKGFQKYVNDPLNKITSTIAQGTKEAFQFPVDMFTATQHMGEETRAMQRAAYGEAPPIPKYGSLEEQSAAERPIARGVAGGLGEAIGGTLGDPRNWPLMGSSSARPLLQKLLSGAFATTMSKDAYDTGKDLHDNWDKYTPEQRAEAFTKMGVIAASAGAAALHTVSHRGNARTQEAATFASRVHESSSKVYDARAVELERATNYQQQAHELAIKARQAETDGTGTRQQTIDAENAASEAASNARKAQEAYANAAEQKNKWASEVDRLNKTIQRSQSPTDLKEQPKFAAAHEDFKHIAPRSTDADVRTARGYLEKYHKDVTPIDSVKDVYEGLGYSKKVGIEDRIAPYVEKYAKDVITTNPAMDVHDKLLESPQADFADIGMKHLEEKYPQLLSPESLTVSEAQRILTDLNSKNRGILEDKPTIKIGTLLQTDPEFAARYHAAASLREGEYGLFNERGVTGIDQLRRDERAIINVENDIRRSLPKADTKVRGSGKSGPFRRAAAWAVRRGAEIEGARVGGPLGAATGGWLGEKFAKSILPGDKTRDQLATRSFKVEGAGQPLTQIRGEGAPSIPYEPSLSPEDLKAIQREFSPLHSELASYYDKNVHDLSYQDAERQFKQDVDDKVSRGIRLEPEEKKIQKLINDQDTADALKAREENAKKAALGPAPSATLPGKANYAMNIPNLPGGLTPEEVIGHEIAHSIVGKKMGIKVVDGVRSHLHAANAEDGAHASVGIDLNEFLDEDGNADINKIKGKMADIATTYVAGGVYQDLAYNTPFTENIGLRSDLKALNQLFKTVGFSDAESSRMIAQAAENAAHILADHLDIIEQHASTREPGLDERYHVSQERLDQIAKDIENAERYRKSTRITGTGERPGKGTGAGREGGIEGTHPERLREAGEGTDEGERGKGKPKPGTRPGVAAADVTAGQGGHAGGGVASEEELARPGRFVKISRSGMATDQGKTPDFTLQPGEAGYQVRPGGEYELKAGVETPATKRGVEGYAKELHGKAVPRSMQYSGPERRVAVEEGESPTGEERRTLPLAGVTGPPPEQLRLISEAKKQIAAAQTVPELTAALNRLKNVTGTEAGLEIAQQGGEKTAQEIRQARAKSSGTPNVVEHLRNIANQFNKSEGRPAIEERKVTVDPRQDELAEAYASSKHEPNNPAVRKSYDSLKKDIDKQYDILVKNGYKIDATENDPYEGEKLGVGGEQTGAEASYQALRKDVTQNRHISVWKGGAPPADHPLSEVDPKSGLTYNEKFRAIHDIFGHVLPDNDFTANGEESAWHQHRQMMHPDSRPALATETRGQTAYVTKYGNFADQRATILPEKFHVRPEDLGQKETTEDRSLPSWWNEQPEHLKGTAEKATKGGEVLRSPVGAIDWKTGSQESKRYGLEVHPEVREKLDHRPTAEDFQRFASKNADLLNKHPELRVGWDTLGDKPELNLGISTDNLEAAKKVASSLDQRSVWDTQEKKEIETGGKNQQQEFPNYPLEQRIADLKGASTKQGTIGDALVEKHGTTDDPKKAGFILSDGRSVPLAAPSHNELLESVGLTGQDAERQQFIKGEGAIRTRYRQSRRGNEFVFTVPEKVTLNQINAMKTAVEHMGENGNIVMEVAGRALTKEGQVVKEFATPRDVDEAARELGVHPSGPLPTKMEFRTGSSVPLIENPLKVGENPSPTDVALALSKYTKTNLPGLELGKAAPEAMKGRAQDIMDDEARYQLSQNNAGQDWYTKDIAKHDDIMRQIRPELANPAKLSLFKMAEAVLSAGHEPTDNVAQAVRAWDDYNKTGEFSPVNPESGEPWGRYGIKSYGNALEILNRLVKEKGEQGASDWLLSNHSVKELREYNTAKRGGRGGGIPGEPDDILPGVFVLGEKRGPFAQNLHGQEAAFTHDQWVNRSWNRWMGTADVDQDGKLVDQPRNTKERQLVKQSFNEASSKIGLTPSSLQAVLWYYEKALYEAHGVKKVGASTFSEGAQKVADDEASSFNFGENALRGKK